MMGKNGHIENGENLAGLLPHHLAGLRARGLSDDTIKANGIRSVTDHLEIGGALNRKYSRKCGPALSIPYVDAIGDVSFRRMRPDNPPTFNGKPAKYLQPKGAAPRAYFPNGSRELVASKAQPIIITEGELKAICAMQHGHCTIGVPGVDCAFVRKTSRLIPDLARIEWAGRPVFICFDSDATSNPAVLEAERLLAAALAKLGAVVKIVRLPSAPDGSKLGLDDYLAANGASAFHALLKSAEDPGDVDPGELRGPAIDADPGIEAMRFLDACKVDGQSLLRFQAGAFLVYRDGRYAEVPATEVRGEVVNYLDQHFSKVWTVSTNNVLDHIKAKCLLRSDIEAPAWLTRQQDDWPAAEVLCTRQQLVHLPSLAAGAERSIRAATPRFFSQSALDFHVDPNAPRPAGWLNFLGRLWPDDPESIGTLQEWFGYCLMPETWLQKILVLIGPKRSGKGTIARILRELIGRRNVAGQTLAGLGTNFGLWPLLGKLLCIISDARLSGRTDTAIVIERLLSISGEDAITCDRKNLVPLTTRLPTRFLILTNELPRLGDSSGAMASRFILLRLTESFYGREDHALTDKLLVELPGILLWAVEGWRRLHDRGRIVQPDSATDLLADLEDLGSPISAFIRERCIVDPACWSAVSDLFASWKAWCDENGRRDAGTQQTFGRDLVAAIPQLKKSRPRCEDGGRYRAYEGIGIRGQTAGGF